MLKKDTKLTNTTINRILACPNCRGDIAEMSEYYRCSSCQYSFDSIKGIPVFLLGFDDNSKLQEEIWAGKTYKVNPETHVFTTIQERFGNRILKSVKLPKGAVAADIGCFIGEKLWQLSHNEDYIGLGIDIAVDSLVAASEMNIYNHFYLAGDLESLPLKDNSVDFIMVFDVIEHLSNPERGFSEVSRVLKKNGVFLLHIPIKDNAFSFFWWKKLLFPDLAAKEYADVGHSEDRMLTSREIKEYVNLYGMKVEKEIFYNSFLVHFFDREVARIAALVSLKLSGRAEMKLERGERAVHKGKIGLLRDLYGRYGVPVLEALSFPDTFLSMLKIGNTYFLIARKES